MDKMSEASGSKVTSDTSENESSKAESTESKPRGKQVILPMDHIPIPNLSNEIDPLFRRFASRFKHASDPVHLAFRLASHLVPAAFPVFHSLIPNPDLFEKNGSTKGTPHNKTPIFPEPLTKLNKPQKQLVRDFLDTFLGNMSWGLTQEKELAGIASAQGLKEDRGKVPFRCEVLLGAARFATIREAHAAKDLPLFIWECALLARAMIHELAHCVVLASEYVREDFSKGQHKGRYGKRSGVRGLCLLEHWPDLDTITRYDLMRSDCKLREGCVLPNEKRAWRLRFEGIALLFQNRFWRVYHQRLEASGGEYPNHMLNFNIGNVITRPIPSREEREEWMRAEKEKEGNDGSEEDSRA
ncbi:hypothetical protein AC578_10811 [Pseudocercospora eumusae]|uniref:SprT-like domain-containing protein n=1 Tax=Pseudocercospora eumusae TaxID=321146 RepID=A0A139GVW3_9PEZI|nr:hypothetical protein AC578_10811 [Pseudocercospora eumusae]